MKHWVAESSCFRTLFGNQRVHGSQTLTKCARRHFYPNFPLIWDKVSDKTSFLVISEILGLFGNWLTADHMFSRHNWYKFVKHVKTLLFPKPKIFSAFFYFWNLHKVPFTNKRVHGSQTSSWNRFKRYYLQNQLYFLQFFSAFQIYIKFGTFWKKTSGFIA